MASDMIKYSVSDDQYNIIQDKCVQATTCSSKMFKNDFIHK